MAMLTLGLCFAKISKQNNYKFRTSGPHCPGTSLWRQEKRHRREADGPAEPRPSGSCDLGLRQLTPELKMQPVPLRARGVVAS